MRRVHSIYWGCFVSVLACGAWATGAFAGQVIITPGAQNQAYGDIFTALSTAPLRARGNTYLKAFSAQLGPVQIGPNQSVLTGLVSGGVGRPNPTSRTLTGSSTGIPVAKKPKGYYFVGPPVVALSNQLKSLVSAPNDIEFIQSTSGQFIGQASQGVDANGSRYVSAFGLDNAANPFAVGQAAGSAYDPFALDAGTAYAYSPIIDVDIQADAPGLDGGVEFFALDSNTYSDANPDTVDYPGGIDDFADEDDNSNPNAGTLWTLDITEDGTTSGPGSMDVDFELNPADNEISFSSGELSTLGCSAGDDTCIDDAIDAELEADFISDGDGGEELANIALLSGATFTPSGTGTVEYAEGVNAGVEDVPEPPSTVVFLAGLMAAFMLRRFRPVAAVRKRTVR